MILRLAELRSQVKSSPSFTMYFQTATASHNLGSAFSERVEDAKDAFEKMVLNSYKETDKITLYSDKVSGQKSGQMLCD